MTKKLLKYTLLAVVAVIGLAEGCKLLLASSKDVVASNYTEVVTAGKLDLASKDQTASTDSSKKKVMTLTLTPMNTVAIFGPIGTSAALIAQDIIKKTSSGYPVYILLNSPGGSVLDGNLIVSAMQAAKAPIYTINFQLCASMCAIIHAFGTKRLVVDRSILMFHEAAGSVEGQFNQMKSRLNVFDRIVSKLDYEIAIRAKMDPAQFRKRLADEIWLDAEDAVEQHFADGLVNVNVNALLTSAASEENQEMLKALSQTSSLLHKVIVNDKLSGQHL